MQIKVKYHKNANSKRKKSGIFKSSKFRQKASKHGAHRRGSHSSRSHHSGSHHGHAKRKKKILLYLVRAVAVAVGSVAVISLVCLGVYFRGKNSLYSEASSETPELELESAGDGWQEGDIRYNGKIYRYNSDMLTFLFMGIDSTDTVEVKESGNEGGQADTLFLFCMNPHTEEIFIIPINRNTMTDIDVYGSNGAYLTTGLGQITLQHAYGDGAELSCERTVATVEKLFYELPIHGYCAINMGGIPFLNDIVGGVSVVSLETFTGSLSGTEFVEGKSYQLVDSMAYDYVRSRDTEVFGSADLRLARQKQYLIAFASRAMAATKEDLTMPITVYNILSQYMGTDLSVDQVAYLATQLVNYTFDNDHMLSIGGETVMGDKFEEFYIDEDSLYEIIIRVFYEEVTED